MRPAAIILLLSAAVLVQGCGAKRGPVGAEGAAPSVGFEETLGAAAALQAEAPYQTLRYNPAPETCGCPDFELRVGDGWWRLRIFPRALPEPDLAALRERLAERLREGDARHVYATGDLDDDLVVVCPNGAYGLEMRVDGVTDSPPPPLTD